MIAEIGHYALVLALLLSLVQASVPMLGAARGNPAWMEVARPAAVGQLVFVASEVLAKHDENYMPAEVAEALKKSGQWKGADAAGETNQ